MCAALNVGHRRNARNPHAEVANTSNPGGTEMGCAGSGNWSAHTVPGKAVLCNPAAVEAVVLGSGALASVGAM